MNARPEPSPAPEQSLHRFIEASQRRLHALQVGALDATSAEREALTRAVIEDLYTAIAELRVTEEELREQNEALIESQERLAAERERYRSLFELAPDAYLVTDGSGVIQEANQPAGRLLGVETHLLIGKSLAHFFGEEGRAEYRALEAALREQQRVEDRRLPLHPRLGGRVPVEVTAGMISASGEHRIHWLIRDTTERLLAEQHARELVRAQAAREQAEAAARRSRVLSEASRILSSSIAYCTTLRSMARFVVPELADSLIVYLLDAEGRLERVAAAHADPQRDAALQQLLSARTPELSSAISPVAKVIRTGTGELVSELGPELLGVRGEPPEHLQILRVVAPRSLIVVPLISGEDVFGAISLACSTPGKHYGAEDLGMAEELASRVTLAVVNARLHAEAQQAAHARQELLHVVSHDLRNSLNAAVLHAELLQVGMQDASSSSSIATIRRTLEQMHRLVKDLLQAEQIEQGSLRLERTPQRLGALIREALDLQQPLAAERHLRLEWRVPDLLPPVLVDGVRLVQVLTNLLSNAIKFTPPGGEILIEAQAGDREVCVSVADTGPGIAATDLPHVFDLYWQGAGGAARGARGAGLGLAIARGIVEGHGGRIWVESRQGAGTIFFFTIPTAHGDE